MGRDRGGLVGPGHGVGRVTAGADPDVSEQLATIPPLPIAHPVRGSSVLGATRCSWLDHRTPSASVIARAARSSTSTSANSSGSACSMYRSQASASTQAVPQQRPLLSQKPGRSRRGRPEWVTACQQRSARPDQLGRWSPIPAAGTPARHRPGRCTSRSCIARSGPAGAVDRNAGPGTRLALPRFGPRRRLLRPAPRQAGPRGECGRDGCKGAHDAQHR